MASRKTTKLLEHATAIARLEKELAIRRAEFDRLASTSDTRNQLSFPPVPTHRPERLLRIAGAMIDIQNDIDFRRAEFERLLSADRGEQEPVGQDLALSPMLRPLARVSSLPVRVQSVLDLSVRPLTAHDIAAQIGDPIDSVRAALSKLHARGTVDRVAIGVYRSTNAGHRRAAGEDD